MDEDIKTNFRYCIFKEPQSNEYNITQVFFKTAQHQQYITFITDFSELSIETGTINFINIENKSQTLKLITNSGLIFELGLENQHTTDNYATENLAQWLNATYLIPIYRHTNIT